MAFREIKIQVRILVFAAFEDAPEWLEVGDIEATRYATEEVV